MDGLQPARRGVAGSSRMRTDWKVSTFTMVASPKAIESRYVEAPRRRTASRISDHDVGADPRQGRRQLGKRDAADVCEIGLAADQVAHDRGEDPGHVAEEDSPRWPIRGLGGHANKESACLSAAPETKILVFDVEDDDAAIIECVRAGTAGGVLRDASPAELVAAVASVAQGTAPLSPRIVTSLFRFVTEHGVQGDIHAPTPAMPAARTLERSARSTWGPRSGSRAMLARSRYTALTSTEVSCPSRSRSPSAMRRLPCTTPTGIGG